MNILQMVKRNMTQFKSLLTESEDKALKGIVFGWKLEPTVILNPIKYL